jgi:hypothetical protein
MATVFEFVVETLDYYKGCGSSPDIIDCPAFDTLNNAAEYAKDCEEPWRIALRRDTGNDEEGLMSRFYAYPDAEGRLQDTMESADGAHDGPAVPGRFRKLVFPVDSRQIAP